MGLYVLSEEAVWYVVLRGHKRLCKHIECGCVIIAVVIKENEE